MKKWLKKILKRNKYSNMLLLKRNERRNKIALQKRQQIINESGQNVVREIEQCLSESKLVYFATCGTLLGLIRENRLLKNDYDMDYAILIQQKEDWSILENSLHKANYKKIRAFSLDGNVTEQTYKNDLGVEIDFFGHFIENGKLCFYSYNRLDGYVYPSEEHWTAYKLVNGKYKGTEKKQTEIGEVTVPVDAEEYLTYNYNDNWRIPDPNFKPNTGKGCSLVEGKYGVITEWG